MLAVLGCIVILAVIGLGFYALHKIRPGWFRIQAGAGQRFTFSIEMGRGSDPTPPDERRELEAGRDKPRELEAGRGQERNSSEPSADSGQGNAAALRVSRLAEPCAEPCGARNVSGRWQAVIVNSPYHVSSSPRPDGGHACSCCLRPWSECVADTGGFDGRARQRTCPPCHDHGPSAMAANRVHIELWRKLAHSRQRDHDATKAGLRNRIAELEQELRDRKYSEIVWPGAGGAWLRGV